MAFNQRSVYHPFHREYLSPLLQDLGTVEIHPFASPILSADPEEVWRYIDRLTSHDYVCRLLRKRVEEHFFGLGKKIHKLNNDKLIYNADNPSNEENGVEIHQILSENKDIQQNAREITLLARQAIELYRSSQTASIYARPIILYYSYTKFQRSSFV